MMALMPGAARAFRARALLDTFNCKEGEDLCCKAPEDFTCWKESTALLDIIYYKATEDFYCKATEHVAVTQLMM
jgi:hypothetical protein